MTADDRFRVEALAAHHDRASFACGAESLDRYLKTQAMQDIRRSANSVFIMIRANAPNRIVGYATLCAYTLEQTAVPDALRKLVPRYPLVSATLIGRLAVASNEQGKGVGGVLLAHVLRKALENTTVVGSSMVVVDALNNDAVRFYEHHGFQKLPDSMRLVIPMSTIKGLAG
jgi:GNAT superfamily N-acetyltransferase